MSDSREAFEAAMREQFNWVDSDFVWQTGNYGSYYALLKTQTAFEGWSARDAEIEALKARVEELERELSNAYSELRKWSDSVFKRESSDE